MRKRRTRFCNRLSVLLCLLGTLPLSAQEIISGYACEQGGVSRYVEVVSEPGYACRVRYTKSSAISYPWNARNEADYCQPKATGLVEKLVGLGWACAAVEEVEAVLQARLERFERYVRILGKVGKSCQFYPTEARFGNLCGDRRDEAVVVYTCEAEAGAWDQHLAVFLELEDDPLIVEVGSSNQRQVTDYFIQHERVVLESDRSARSAIRCDYVAETGWQLSED